MEHSKTVDSIKEMEVNDAVTIKNLSKIDIKKETVDQLIERADWLTLIRDAVYDTLIIEIKNRVPFELLDVSYDIYTTTSFLIEDIERELQSRED